jgi:hypothetical protein
MATINKATENSVTTDIIRKVHFTLADIKTGEEILGFLRSTEPIFMEEVTRFIRTEVSRMRYSLTEPQAMYIGSVIGASYIAGFLIAREAFNQMFNGMIKFKSDISSVLKQEDIDKIIDQSRDQGKSYKEIARVIRNMMTQADKPAKEKKVSPTSRGKRLDIGSLD